MKISSLLLMAGMLGALPVLAQKEQWLEYHTGNEGLTYRQLNSTNTPPEGVALPKLNARPLFARWQTPMDPSGGRWMCFDRTRQTGPYNRLFIDTTGNGRLDDKTPLQARVEANYAFFPAAAMVFKGEDGPVTYHLMLRFYQYKERPVQIMASSVSWYESKLNFDGVKKRVKLIDGNVNGVFNDIREDPYDSDRITIEDDKVGERFLGRMVEVNGKFYRIEVARDGAFIKMEKAENVELGYVHVPENVSQFSAFGQNGHFMRTPVKGEFTLPTGKYRMVRWVIDRKDEKGVAWTLSGYNFPDTANFDVAAAKTAEVQVGEPVKAELKAEEGTNRLVNFNLSFVGHQKESVRILCGNDWPRGPKLTLTNTSGALAYTNTFEFG